MNSEDLKNYIKERLNNTLFFTFILSMGFHYWKIVLVTLSTEMGVLSKIETIEKYLLLSDSFWCNVLKSIGLALCVSIVTVIAKRASVIFNSSLDVITSNIVSKFKEKQDRSSYSLFKKINYVLYKINKKNIKLIVNLSKNGENINSQFLQFEGEYIKNFREDFGKNNKLLEDLYNSYLKNNSQKVIELYNNFQSTDKDSEAFYSNKITLE